MNNSFWNKKIPTLLGLFIILLGIVATTFLTKNTQLLQTNASSSTQPKNVRITNITDSSFSVSYSTDAQVSGSLNYGKDKNFGQSALDEKSQQTGNVGNYFVHSITVKNLNPLTKYYFTILSGQQAYTTNDLPFEITTGPPLTPEANQKLVLKGQIKLLDGTVPTEAIVYVTGDNSQVLSSLIDANGNYQISLAQMRNLDLSSFYSFNENSVVKILAVGNLVSSNTVLYYSQSEDVPLIILSKDYDFRATSTQEASPSAAFENLSSLISTPAAIQKTPKIIAPQKDQGFSSQQPLFKGEGLPNQNVKIIIHSDEQIQTTVTTDNSGSWNYKPDSTLSPGNHTITIVTKNASGILQTITQSFVVYAADGDVTPTITPTPTITADEITPNSTISATPTDTEKPLPPTGNQFIITAGIVGIFMSLMGGLLFLLSHREI